MSRNSYIGDQSSQLRTFLTREFGVNARSVMFVRDATPHWRVELAPRDFLSDEERARAEFDGYPIEFHQRTIHRHLRQPVGY